MAWREFCAHSIPAPSKRGFGSTVMCEMVKMRLEAEAHLDFPSTGLVWQIQCAAEQILQAKRSSSIGKNVEPADSKPAVSGRPRVLVVEDEPIVALEIAEVLAKSGFKVIGPARSVNQALGLISQHGCDAAVLDINLGSETSEAVALELDKHGTQFVTLSGYSRDQHPSAFNGAVALAKPMVAEALVAELGKCVSADAGYELRPAAALV
jgi:CheY-like chemotaxis protein